MIVAGTGHRPDKLGGYGADVTTKLRRVAADWLQDNRPERVITGMVLGWDQALGWAAYDLGIPFTAALPFDGMEAKWPALSQQWYRDLLAKADEAIEVCPPGYAPWKMQKRNEYMVDNCDLVLALWNGTSSGTANCIAYAGQQEKEIVNLWEKYNEHQ